MKVIYKTDVVKEISALISKAKTNTKELDFIEVTREEYKTLLTSKRLDIKIDNDKRIHASFEGVTIVPEGGVSNLMSEQDDKDLGDISTHQLVGQIIAPFFMRQVSPSKSHYLYVSRYDPSKAND